MRYNTQGIYNTEKFSNLVNNKFKDEKQQKIKVKIESGKGKYHGGGKLFVEFYKDNKTDMIGNRRMLFKKIGRGDKKEKEFTLKNVSPNSKIYAKIINTTKDGINIVKVTINYNDKDYIFKKNGQKITSENDNNRVANDNTVGWTKVEKKSPNIRWFSINETINEEEQEEQMSEEEQRKKVPTGRRRVPTVDPVIHTVKRKIIKRTKNFVEDEEEEQMDEDEQMEEEEQMDEDEQMEEEEQIPENDIDLDDVWDNENEPEVYIDEELEEENNRKIEDAAKRGIKLNIGRNIVPKEIIIESKKDQEINFIKKYAFIIGILVFILLIYFASTFVEN